MHHHVTLVSRRVHRKLLSARASSRLSIFRMAWWIDTGDARRVSMCRSCSWRGEKSTRGSAISRRWRKREREKRWSDRNAKQLKWLHVNHLSATLRRALPSFLLPLFPTRPFCPSFFDDTIVASPITHHDSIVNQNAALSGTKVPNKIHKFPLYCARSGFRQKFSKFRK